ncbi:peptide-methionine (R)-S-oxide reductase MsrB [Aquisphaera insulae]|uniref:peptide-methionine (R)-S-oxide reductase MsrB n=1 Tax=Aquisphaera insulae TaxID=2712864 RepID=UPI0013EC0725|nr:peptide-methionine (R)-S-oxide reductase MsrB [Aquisphaera insulae]
MGLLLGSRGRFVLITGLSWACSLAAPAIAQDPFRPPAEASAPAKPGETDAPEKSDAAKPAADGKAGTKSPSARSGEPERVIKTNEEWRKLLNADEFMVTRLKATEPAFSGKYATGHFKGTFDCVCCGAPLFESAHKFDSGTGWPSFFRPASEKALETAMDYSEPSEARVEVTCRRCGAHLGHVFQDGPPPTGLRYCINSLSLKLDAEKTAKPATQGASRKGGRPAATARRGRATTGRDASEENNAGSKSDVKPTSRQPRF